MDSSNAIAPNPADTRPKTTHLVCWRSAGRRYVPVAVHLRTYGDESEGSLAQQKSRRGNELAILKIDLGKSQ